MQHSNGYLNYICTDKKYKRCGKLFGVLDTKNYAWKDTRGNTVKFYCSYTCREASRREKEKGTARDCLRDTREDMGYRMKDIADLIGIPVSRYRYIELGLKQTDKEMQAKIAKILRKTPEVLFHG